MWFLAKYLVFCFITYLAYKCGEARLLKGPIILLLYFAVAAVVFML